MKPFLILQLRANQAAAEGEFNAYLKYGGLSPHEVTRIRMESDALPQIDLKDYSGVIVGGGPWNISDTPEEKDERQKIAEAWLDDLLTRVVERDTPYLGICYGLGALNVNQGAGVSKERYSENPSAIDIELLPQANRDPLLIDLPSSFRAFVGHKEACQELPKGTVWLARSKDCPIQMFRLGHNVYGTQFHPELDAEGICVRVDAYKDAGYYPPEEAELLKEKLGKETVTVPMQILKRFVMRYKK